MNEDETWHLGRPWPWQHCVRWGPNSPPPTKRAQPPIFGPCLLWPKGWMDEDATWYGSRPRPRPHCVGRGLSSAQRKGTAALVLFLAHVYCGHGRPSQLLLSSCLILFGHSSCSTLILIVLVIVIKPALHVYPVSVETKFSMRMGKTPEQIGYC